MDNFIINTLNIILELKFSPLVLIGLMITSLSLILNLKDNNIYLKRFKEHKNIKSFIKNIHKTTMILLAMFILSILSSYIDIPKNGEFVQINYLIFTPLCISYLFLLLLMIKNLFSISYIIREIVLTSLHDD